MLIARLIAYKQFRNAAAMPETAWRHRPAYPGPPAQIRNFSIPYPTTSRASRCAGSPVICADLDSRREELSARAEHIAPKRLPVALTVASVDRVTMANPHTTFEALLDGESTPEQVVVTFLMILQLYKQRREARAAWTTSGR